MDKNAIKKYAVWARRELISRVSQRAAYFEITEDGFGDPAADSVLGRVLSAEEKTQRQALIAQIRQKGYRQVMEEVAYTWFNRFIALRFMEVNGYLPSHVRVFTDEANQFKPQILAEAIHMELDGLDMQKIYAFKNANDDDGLFKYMVIVQCNALSSILPGMFQRISDYTELLFPDNLLREGSVLQQMVELIPEEDWKDAVQIIGWLYQYYNTELKAQADKDVKNGKKITGRNLPEKTQIFTPDWIVRYMVENSLGRLWVEGHPNDKLKFGWRFYLEEARQEPEVQAQLAEIRKEYATMSPEQIKCIDPCCGSGHILAYLFDVLVQIYESYGYTTREAVESIVKNNLYGLDIDDRAAQLAYFAVMMKARQYDRRFFSRRIQPNVYPIQESNGIDRFALEYFCDGDFKLKAAMDSIIKELYDAKEYGSILNITSVDFAALYARFGEVQNDINMSREVVLNSLLPLVQTAEALSQKYDVAITNPPYLGLRNIGSKTLEYIQCNYPNSKNDFFAVFIDRALNITKTNGWVSLVTAESWLSLSSFEKIRDRILKETMICNMLHLGEGAFDAGFGTVAFVLSHKRISDFAGQYYRLTDLETSEEKKFAIENGVSSRLFRAKQDDFYNIPGAAVSYWVNEKVFAIFRQYPALGSIAEPRQGLTTCDNDRFMRFWHEVPFGNVCFTCSSPEESEDLPQRWFPYNKGGEPRKWYGNNDYVVNWQYNGSEVKEFVASKYVSYSRTVKNIPYYFRKGLTWSAIAKKYAVRAYDKGFIFADKGQAIFAGEELYYYLCGLMNSKFTDMILEIISPTLDFNCGYIKKIPIAIRENQIKCVEPLTKDNITLSKEDWDSFETSWNFTKHPLARSVSTVSDAFAQWETECDDRFAQLKANEEELNRIFTDIYGLQDELTPEVADKDVTVHYLVDTKDEIPASLQGSNYVLTRRDAVISLISYAVGCMFGRYTIYADGLLYAGGLGGHYSLLVEKIQDLLKAQGKSMFPENEFYPDEDNVIPICDDEYFDDDIVGRFVKFIETVYGSDTLEENLKFIADALGGKGTPRDVIRSYFLNDFYADHCKTYQKRPIYWLFDSGKKNGFKALIYLHRYQRDLLARMRTDYVHEQQERYRTQLSHLADALEHASGADKVRLTKQQKKLQDQSRELQTYEEKIHHLADQNIELDLDDGVKVNYAKFGDVLAKIK